jgi:DNA-binding MarR family transcriptional regulator
MTQLLLTGHPARRTDPASSHVAAREITRSGLRAAQAEQVSLALTLWPGHTSRELASRAHLDRHMVARRLPELERAGTVKRGPMRACRESKRLAVTWWPLDNSDD